MQLTQKIRIYPSSEQEKVLWIGKRFLIKVFYKTTGIVDSRGKAPEQYPDNEDGLDDGEEEES